MNTNLIFYYIILSVLVILMGVTVYYKKYMYTYALGLLSVIFAILMFVYVWREDYNVYPKDKDSNYRNKVVWVNVDKLDIFNVEHNKWAKNLLLNQAPNKLGIYSNKYNVTTLDILRYKETFYEFFGYNSEYIYLENAKLNEKTKRFCKEKDLKVKKFSMRIK